MKLLVVAMPDSIHTARWLRQLEAQRWSVHVFSSHAAGWAHPQLAGVTVHGLFRSSHRGVRQHGIPVLQRDVAFTAERIVDRIAPRLRRDLLADWIRREQPDVVHSLEIQHAGYLTLDALERIGGTFPPWIVTNWGSDIYRFSGDPAHAPRIREVLALCDAYTCECERDVRLARSMGLQGLTFPPSPNAGGYDLARAGALRGGAPSSRRVVMLKGYQHWAGRALVGLAAIEACAPQLRGHRICVYSATRDVVTEARGVSRRTGLEFEIIPLDAAVPHEEMLRRHGAARVSIGLSTSDGVSTSFLEALLMGSFPIQTWTSCANEWIEDGETGILVGPDDPEEVAGALQRALRDDHLVDRAAVANSEVATRRLDERALRQQSIEMYRTVAALRSRSGAADGPAAGVQGRG